MLLRAQTRDPITAVSQAALFQIRGGGSLWAWQTWDDSTHFTQKWKRDKWSKTCMCLPHKKNLLTQTGPQVGHKFGMDPPISSPYSILSKEVKRPLNEKLCSEEKQRLIINQEWAEKREKKEKRFMFSSLSTHQVMTCAFPSAWLEFVNETTPAKPWNLKCLPLSLRPSTLFMLLFLAVSPLYPSSCGFHLLLAVLPSPLFARVPPHPGNSF